MKFIIGLTLTIILSCQSSGASIIGEQDLNGVGLIEKVCFFPAFIFTKFWNYNTPFLNSSRVYVFWVWQNYFEVSCYCYADLSCPKNLNTVWSKVDQFFMPKQMVNGFWMV